MQRGKSNTNIRPAPYEIWGRDIDPAAVAQMDDACSLPVSVRGYVNLNIAENTVISSGNLALYNLPLDRDLARLINLKFNRYD